MYVLRRQQIVNRPLGEVFDFFQRPENLSLITPPELGFELLSPSPVLMEQGRIIDYTIRLFKLPVHWRSLISDYHPPNEFVDQQIQGPYRVWHHQHRFEDLGDRTRLIDEVHYALPHYLPLASMINRFYVRPHLEHIFDFRAETFAHLFGGIIEAPDTQGDPLCE